MIPAAPSLTVYAYVTPVSIPSHPSSTPYLYTMPAGYSLRRNISCTADEHDCGQTWKAGSTLMRRCCPFGTNCDKSSNKCLVTNSQPLDNRCANSTWSLYYANDFFCCDRDTLAFEWVGGQIDGYAGCAEQGYELVPKQSSLVARTTGKSMSCLLSGVGFKPLLINISFTIDTINLVNINNISIFVPSDTDHRACHLRSRRL